MLTATSANANGTVTWQNEGTNRYLEVYQSSTSNGGWVGTWPWNGTNTQYWDDYKLSDNYWVEFNHNSGLLLTAYNSCSNGITQWTTDTGNHVFTTQEWRELSTADGWLLINRAGCSGDAYHDTISQSFDDPNVYFVYLYPENHNPLIDGPQGCESTKTIGAPYICLFR